MMVPIRVDPLLLLVAGLVIDALFGDMPAVFRYVPHPVVLAGRAIAFFDRKLNRETRSEMSRSRFSCWLLSVRWSWFIWLATV